MTTPYDPAQPTLTARIAAELIAHEGIVREAYRDSVGVWTWSVGITDASGHRVRRYRDNPQTLGRCLEIYLWVLEKRYLPAVIAAFGDHMPSEHELAAALSFHWNTGAIARADWMRLIRAGDRDGAREGIMKRCRPASLTARRRREQALFFDGLWTGNGTALVYEVARPSYHPVRGRRQPVLDTLRILLGERAEPEPTAGAVPAVAACPALPAKPMAASPAPAHGVEGNWFTRLFTG